MDAQRHNSAAQEAARVRHRDRRRMVLEQTAAKVADESCRSLILCLRVNSPLSEVASATGIALDRLHAAASGTGLLGAGEVARVDAWLGVVWARHAQRQGLCVDEDEMADALATAARCGVSRLK